MIDHKILLYSYWVVPNDHPEEIHIDEEEMKELCKLWEEHYEV